MDYIHRLESIFGQLIESTPQDLKRAINHIGLTRADVIPYLGEPGIYPYDRKLLYRSNHVEILVMNWASNRECAPYDHGNSSRLCPADYLHEGVRSQQMYSLHRYR